MRTRPLKDSDIPVLRAMAEVSGHPYPDLSADELEVVVVVADDDDRPVMAAAAKRCLELYLWSSDFRRPLAKIGCLQMLHSEMRRILRDHGYNEANAFLPPKIASKFGRRLERTFGWVKNWPSWTRRI